MVRRRRRRRRPGALALRVNALTALLGLAVVVLYVAVYTPLKTRSTLCTLAGAVCGQSRR